MKHRSLLLLSTVMIAILVAVGGAMIAIAHPVKPAPTPAVVATCDQQLGADTSPDFEPITSCSGGCPFLIGDCEFDGDTCNCPRGPGHCVACGPFLEDFKCVKDP